MAVFLTQATIWIAMLAWTIAILARDRRAWTLAFVFYIAHILSAYESHYMWSHRIALDETARRTAEVMGWKTGIGLWFNYAFAAILAIDLVSQWLYRRREFPRTIDGLVFLMILNGSVVFGDGPVRYYGALLCAAIILGWIVRVRESSSPISSPPP